MSQGAHVRIAKLVGNHQPIFSALGTGTQGESVLGVAAGVSISLGEREVVGTAEQVLGVSAGELEAQMGDLLTSLLEEEVGDLAEFANVFTGGVVDGGGGADERGADEGENGGGLHFEMVCFGLIWMMKSMKSMMRMMRTEMIAKVGGLVELLCMCIYVCTNIYHGSLGLLRPSSVQGVGLPRFTNMAPFWGDSLPCLVCQPEAQARDS